MREVVKMRIPGCGKITASLTGKIRSRVLMRSKRGQDRSCHGITYVPNYLLSSSGLGGEWKRRQLAEIRFCALGAPEDVVETSDIQPAVNWSGPSIVGCLLDAIPWTHSDPRPQREATTNLAAFSYPGSVGEHIFVTGIWGLLRNLTCFPRCFAIHTHTHTHSDGYAERLIA